MEWTIAGQQEPKSGMIDSRRRKRISQRLYLVGVILEVCVVAVADISRKAKARYTKELDLIIATSPTILSFSW